MVPLPPGTEAPTDRFARSTREMVDWAASTTKAFLLSAVNTDIIAFFPKGMV